jgi:hypothetical protein
MQPCFGLEIDWWHPRFRTWRDVPAARFGRTVGQLDMTATRSGP